MRSALVLNATYEPLSIVPARRAACLVLAEKAEIVHDDGTELHSARLNIPSPTVIRLRYVVKVPYQRVAALSRRAIFKLYWSEYHRIATELAVEILGAEAMIPSGRWPSSAFQADDAGAPNDSASWVGTFLTARAGTIYAGSSQIQRNIVGEMVLGLPKEPKV